MPEAPSNRVGQRKMTSVFYRQTEKQIPNKFGTLRIDKAKKKKRNNMNMTCLIRRKVGPIFTEVIYWSKKR